MSHSEFIRVRGKPSFSNLTGSKLRIADRCPGLEQLAPMGRCNKAIQLGLEGIDRYRIHLVVSPMYYYCN